MKQLAKVAVIAISVTTIAFGASAFAKRTGGDHSARILSRIQDKLNLDPNQVEALNTLHTEFQETRQLMRGDGNVTRESIKRMLTADTFDQGAALDMISSRTAALQNNAPELVAAAAVFLDGLNAEQKTDIQNMLNRMGNRHDRGHHRMKFDSDDE